ncbi:conserved hypothetical protein [Trichinella spiralis]|uniref:hypothetical protein n=1 Tax=Trichinella spiralis TaxID=6334 RepID=UPI0001EFEF98|nr:conserved hypothetical protein [Trichinella spiralis]
MSSHATNAYRQKRNISHFCCCENRRLNEIFAQLDKNCRNVEINDHESNNQSSVGENSSIKAFHKPAYIKRRHRKENNISNNAGKEESAYATHMLLESRVSKTYSSCRSSSE